MRQRQSEIDAAGHASYREFGCVAPGLAVASLVDPWLIRGYPEDVVSLGNSQHERRSTPWRIARASPDLAGHRTRFSAMAIRESLALALTRAFLAGPWTADELASRAYSIFREERPRQWLASLISRILTDFPANGPLPTERRLRLFVRSKTRIARHEREPGATRLVQRSPAWPRQMQPASGVPATWTVPQIVSTAELADWLQVSIGELGWFANVAGWSSATNREALHHYRYRWLKKPSGGVRLLETPKPRLKQMQRLILDWILNHVPVHSAAHAFRTGHSVSTYVAPHVGQDVVLHIDLRDFFPSIQASRINATFRTMGYPEPIAVLLTGLCTNEAPADVLGGGLRRLSHEAIWLRLRSPHLPQGAPTSPALANLCAFKLDRRLDGLAKSVAAQYTRYADDLVFSGGRDLLPSLPRLRVLIAAIVLDEGLEIRQRKTRVMVAGTRQQVAGICLNQHANIPRETFDALKATLHNCRRFGPDSQNHQQHPRFREHLQGRLAYWQSICPDRIARLWQVFNDIQWPEAPCHE